MLITVVLVVGLILWARWLKGLPRPADWLGWIVPFLAIAGAICVGAYAFGMLGDSIMHAWLAQRSLQFLLIVELMVALMLGVATLRHFMVPPPPEETPR